MKALAHTVPTIEIKERTYDYFSTEVDTLMETKDLKKDEAIFNVLREYIKSLKNILFEGNG